MIINFQFTNLILAIISAVAITINGLEVRWVVVFK